MWGFKSPLAHKCDVARHRKRSEPPSGFGSFGFTGSEWCAGEVSGAVVAASGVEGEGSQGFAGGGVDDAGAEVTRRTE
jgi:hypothetical protein